MVSEERADQVRFLGNCPPKSPGGGGSPIYGLYTYVPRNRVWFLRFSVLKWDIFFDAFVYTEVSFWPPATKFCGRHH